MIDEIGQVAGGTAGAGYVDFGKDVEQEDRLDEDDDGDRPRQMRQHDIEEEGKRRRAVHFGGFLLLLVERLDGGEQNEVAKGSHCQATMMMTAVSGIWANQSIGCSPTDFMIQANRPETGCISMFFQTSALTVGMMKNGAITMRRTMLRPKIG